MVRQGSSGEKKALKKARVRLICIIAGAVLAALLVPLAARAWLALPRPVNAPLVAAFWGSPVNISNNTHDDGMRVYPVIAAQDENVYAMWSRRRTDTEGEYDPYYVGSSNDGGIWNAPAPTNLQDAPANGTYAPLGMTVDSSGGLHFIWAEEEGTDYKIYYKYGSQNAEPITTTTQTALQPDVAVVGSSTVHVVWSQNLSDIYYNTKSIGGTWEDANQEKLFSSASVVAQYPDVVADSSGRVHVAWVEEFGSASGTILYQRRSAAGVWLTNIITVSMGVDNSHMPALAVGDGTTVYAVWDEWIGAGQQYVRFSESMDGGDSWSQSEQISDPFAVNGAISTFLVSAIALDSSGKVHVAWSGASDAGGEETIYYKSGEKGVSWSWSPPDTVYQSGNNITAAIAVSGDFVHLIWARRPSPGGTYDVYYSRTSVLAGDIYLPIIMKSH
jgi:hypothetical protein